MLHAMEPCRARSPDRSSIPFSGRLALAAGSDSLYPLQFHDAAIVPEETTVPPLESLSLLEVESYRRLRTQAPGTAEPRALHSSYGLQSGHEPLIRLAGAVTARDVERLHDR